jgi:hypothetical protein
MAPQSVGNDGGGSMWRGNLRCGAHTYVHERLLTIYQILPRSSQITVLLESRELQRQTIFTTTAGKRDIEYPGRFKLTQ